VEVAGDPPVLVAQIPLCDIGQVLLAHASRCDERYLEKPMRR